MSIMFKMGRAQRGSTYVPKVGEVIMQEMPEGSDPKFRTVVGDGTTPVDDLPSLIPYDLHARVSRLEEELKELKGRLP